MRKGEPSLLRAFSAGFASVRSTRSFGSSAAERGTLLIPEQMSDFTPNRQQGQLLRIEWVDV